LSGFSSTGVGTALAACRFKRVAHTFAWFRACGEERVVGGKASQKNNLSNYGAGILAAGKALARRISARICNDRATPPAVNRTSQNAPVIFSRCRSPDIKQALLERLPGENQMNKEKWTKLRLTPLIL
jgi:hypothetical protein